MADKKILILTGVLVAGAAGVLLLDETRRAKPDPRVGTVVVDTAAVADVDRIEVKKGETSLVVVKGEGNTWRLGEQAGFAADASKVARLFDELGRAKLAMLVGSKKEALGELGLEDGQATALTLAAQGKALATVRLGGARRGGGTYVRMGDEAKAYVTDQALAVTPDAEQWEMKTLLDVDRTQIKSVSFVPAAALKKKPVTLAREKAEEALKVDGLLAGVTFSRRLDKSNEEARTALAQPSKAIVTLFDGRSYEVGVGSVGESSKRHFLTIASADPALSKVMETWSFEVPEHVAQRFEKGEEDFAEAAKTKG